MYAQIVLMAVFAIGLGGGCDGGGGTTQASPPISPPPSPGDPAIAVTSPTVFSSSPVRISFSITNFTIGLPGTPHMRFSIDGKAWHDFYNGSGIDSENGVLLNGTHNHEVHWATANAFDILELADGPHQVEVLLVDGLNTELPNSEAKRIHNFTLQSVVSGTLRLEPVLLGLNDVVAMAQASDGRIFFSERATGNVQVINPGWQLASVPFCQVSVQNPIIGEQGLLGLALDPNFVVNQTLYVYYTHLGGTNRVSKLTNSGSGCTETVILNNLPTNGTHNGGVLTFGPDGMLYLFIGDAERPDDAQNPDSLGGKVLRVTSSGSPAPGNPFSSSANAQKVYSLGHRNCFGITFHPSTGALWISENGPADNDEVNRIVSGRNYGWPIVRGITSNPSYTNPIVAFTPVIAPTGIVGIPSDSSVYPAAYRGNLLMAAYIGGSIHLVVPNGSNPDNPGTTSVVYSGGAGGLGLLNLMLGTDGYVYATNGNAIYRVVPN